MIKLCQVEAPKLAYDAIIKVLDSGVFIKGPKVEEFESKWAERCGMKYCVAVDSGAMALELLVQILRPVSTFPWTYKAVWNAMDRISGHHEFDEHRPDIYAHHLHDQPPKYKPMIEDCSHCHGYAPIADNAVWSFYPTKILGACGDAGAITTNSESIRDRVRELRDHGDFGTNGRMDELQAVVLLEKLKTLDLAIAKRKHIVDYYDRLLNRKTPGNYHYVYAIEGSQDKVDRLREMGVESKLYYDDRFMALPLHEQLKNSEIEEVAKCVLSL